MRPSSGPRSSGDLNDSYAANAPSEEALTIRGATRPTRSSAKYESSSINVLFSSVTSTSMNATNGVVTYCNPWLRAAPGPLFWSSETTRAPAMSAIACGDASLTTMMVAAVVESLVSVSTRVWSKRASFELRTCAGITILTSANVKGCSLPTMCVG